MKDREILLLPSALDFLVPLNVPPRQSAESAKSEIVLPKTIEFITIVLYAKVTVGWEVLNLWKARGNLSRGELSLSVYCH